MFTSFLIFLDVVLFIATTALVIALLFGNAILLKRKILRPPTERGYKREVIISCIVGTIILFFAYFVVMYMWAIGTLKSALSSTQLFFFKLPWFIFYPGLFIGGLVPCMLYVYFFEVLYPKLNSELSRLPPKKENASENGVYVVGVLFLFMIGLSIASERQLISPRDKYLLRQEINTKWVDLVNEMRPALIKDLQPLIDSKPTEEFVIVASAKWLILEGPTFRPALEQKHLKTELCANKPEEVRYILVISDARVKSTGFYRYVGQHGSYQERFQYTYTINVIDWASKTLVFRDVLGSEDSWSKIPEAQDKPRYTIKQWLDRKNLYKPFG